VKLLLDQNISYKVANKLNVHFPGCRQVRELNLENKSDKEIWNFAKKEDYTIVTFDADFYDLVTLYGHPPKVIWLRLGNTKSDSLVQIFLTHFDLINAFIVDANYSEVGCLEIDG
jgi:predicted nuclease of predicted toxin-antitoxin system